MLSICNKTARVNVTVPEVVPGKTVNNIRFDKWENIFMIKFFDFCSGIGGGRIGLEKNGLICVGHSEIDDKTAKTYQIFFDDNRNYGDLTKLDISTLPDFEFMVAGFPCQTFSIIGRREGFKDKRGQIIYSLIEIMKGKKVKYFIFVLRK